MAGTASKHSGCTTSVRRSRRNPKAEAQQQEQKDRNDSAFDAIRQRIKEVQSNG